MFHFFRKVQEIISSVHLSNPDAVVSVTNTRYSKTPFDKNYRGCCVMKEDSLASVCFQTTDGNDMIFEQPHRCYVNFPAPGAYPHTLWVGRKLELYEGKSLVGIMVIEEIINKNLDRNIKYKDQDKILQNDRVLNQALKRSLEWGRKFTMPLDIKLMRLFPALSGTDIERVSEYVIRVKDDVLWEIYYRNWDAQEEVLKIDAKNVVIEKYPWINKDNLASLDAQGMYYAWHG